MLIERHVRINVVFDVNSDMSGALPLTDERVSIPLPHLLGRVWQVFRRNNEYCLAVVLRNSVCAEVLPNCSLTPMQFSDLVMYLPNKKEAGRWRMPFALMCGRGFRVWHRHQLPKELSPSVVGVLQRLTSTGIDEHLLPYLPPQISWSDYEYSPHGEWNPPTGAVR